MSKVSLQPKASVPFKFPLVCQLPAVSRDRGLSEAIATDFLFEAIQLVTCEITLSFLLAFFLTHHLISPFFSGKIWTKKIIKFKQHPPHPPLPKKELPSGYSALGDTTLETAFFRRQQTAFVLHQQR